MNNAIKVNAYIEQIKITLPRILSLYDFNSLNESYGMGDRFFWAWKLIDFPNATFQGVVNGLARLLANNILPTNFSREKMLLRIDAIFEGTKKILYKNGSLVEAFPFESSYCVTALIAYDFLTAIELLGETISMERKNNYLSIIEPMINFLLRSKESHAFISNHLATSSAALIKWSCFTAQPEANKQGYNLLEQIISKQSKEGWFLEYEGADPGYQSFSEYYLADIYNMRPEENLRESLRKSIQFLWYFAHPDGSFGGAYGSRNTRFYCPGGIAYLAKAIPEAKALSHFMQKSISNLQTVTLSVIDEPNLIPMFNSYCWAAAIDRETITETGAMVELPCMSNIEETRYFEEAGLVIDKKNNCYTIISTHKGGVCYHFVDNKLKFLSSGMIVQDKHGDILTTQVYNKKNEVSMNGQEIKICANFSYFKNILPTPYKFICLRLASISIMRVTWIRETIKKYLVKLLITKKRFTNYKNQRIIKLGHNLNIDDKFSSAFERVELTQNYIPVIHMASQGYWHNQDELL